MFAKDLMSTLMRGKANESIGDVACVDAKNMGHLRASHSKKFDFLLVPLTQYGVKKIMKMTVFLFSKFLHLPFLFWP